MCLNFTQLDAIKQETDYLPGVKSGMRSCLKHRAAIQHGFSLVELITIMLILGVLGAVAMPRFFERSTFDARGFYDQVISTLRFAQKTAIAQHRFVCVAFAGNSLTLTFDQIPPSAAHTAAACGNQLTDPSGKTPYIIAAPSGVALAGANFSFDALGRASIAVAPITVDGYTINIDQATGYVR
jgi:MSHA pilin protein MshC